jgi:exosortase
LRRLATLGSNYLLQTFGFAAVAEGNTIYLDNGPLLVHEACSGLSMLLIFFALSTAVVIVVKRPWLDRGVILLSTVPIAVIANVIRITATGMAQEYVGVKQARTFFHDWAGFLMMPLALAMLWAELWLLAHLLPEEAEAKISPLGLPLSRTAPAAKKKTGPKSPLRLGSEQ